jgi:rhodanese-related sulfurtransferase
MMLDLVARAACLLGAGMALGFAINAARADGVRLGAFAAPTACTVAVAPAAPSSAPAGVTATEVLAPRDAAVLCSDPTALVADVRSAARFAEGHVAGAIHLPCAASGRVVSDAAELLGAKRTLIVYGEDTADALLVAEEMRRRVGRSGLRIVVIEGGFARWSQANLACSSGPCPECATTP